MNETKKAVLGLIPAKRCPDYDDECALVENHVACFTGGVTFLPSLIIWTPPTDGYCPFVMGMMQRW